MSKITEPPKTICRNCKWHRDLDDGDPIGCQFIKHICDAPDVRKPVTYCPITGEAEKPEDVYCVHVNNGNCPHFVKRGWLKK